jgi:hypothetical protein
VTGFIERRKKYKRKVNIRFNNLDYTECKCPNRYGLVVAIFSPGSFLAAKKFMTRNSLLLYLPLPSEKNIHRDSHGLERIGEIQLVKGRYRYSERMVENTYSKKDMIGNKFQDVYAYSIWKR